MSRIPLPALNHAWAAHAHPHAHSSAPPPPDSDSGSSVVTDRSASPPETPFTGHLAAPTSLSALPHPSSFGHSVPPSATVGTSSSSILQSSTVGLPLSPSAQPLDPGDADNYSSAPPAKRRRGAAACTMCRRLKMRCRGGENGPPCERCRMSGHECIFEQSSRAKKGNKAQRVEAMAESLQKMEQTLAIVLQSIGSGQAPPETAQGALTEAAASASSLRDSPTVHAGTSRAPQPERSTTADPRPQNSSAYAAPQLPNQLYSSTDGPSRPMARSATVGNVPTRTIEAPYPIRANTRPNSRSGINSDSSRDAIPPLAEQIERPRRPSSRSSYEGDATSERQRRIKNLLDRCSQYTPQSLSERGEVEQGSHSQESPAEAVPSNALDPLGLLAEASLNTQKWPRSSTGESTPGGSPHQLTERQGQETTTPSDKAPSVQPLTSTDSGADRSIPRGVANRSYFRPSFINFPSLRKILIERELPPTLVDDGVVTEDEVTDLFQIYFQSCIHYALILDPAWHTPKFVLSRSPFLFTAIICIASQFYAPRPDLHEKALEYAKNCAFTVLENGLKSVEIVQAFLLMSLWGESSPNIEQDTAWIFSGLAIRIATDISLDRMAKIELDLNSDPKDPEALEREREALNRTRTWYTCFVIDRMFASQTGKAYIVRDDKIIRNARTWCMQRQSQPWDVGIAALVELYRIQSRQMDFLHSSAQSGLGVETDQANVLRVFNRQLDEWRQVWRFEDLVHQFRNRNASTGSSMIYTADGFQEAPRDDSNLSAHSTDRRAVSDSTEYPGRQAAQKEAAAMLDILGTVKDEEGKHSQVMPPANAFIERSLYFLVRQGTMRYHYTVLFLNSLGLQQFLDHPESNDVETPSYYFRCKGAAMCILRGAARLGIDLRYAPDSEFLMIAYAGVFLLKLIRPVFAGYSNEEEVIEAVRRLASFLIRISVNERHTPYLYGTFLNILLQSRDEQGKTQNQADRAATTPAEASTAPEIVPGGNTPAVSAQLDLGQNTFGSSSAASYPAAMQLLTGIPYISAGEESVLAPGTSAWQQQVEFPSEQTLTDSFWSSLLPPGFEALQDIMGSTGSMLPPQPGTASTPAFPTPGAATFQQPRDPDPALGSTHPQSWFSFPASTPSMSHADTLTGSSAMVLPPPSLDTNGR